MGIMELSRNFEVDRYNILEGIENADGIVRMDGRLDELLHRASTIFLKHGAHSRFGVALLQAHYHVNDGERMSQRLTAMEGEPALVTEPTISDADYATEV